MVCGIFGYKVEDLVARMNALRFDTEEMDEFRNNTVRRLIRYPNSRAAVNEALWLLEVPVLYHGVAGDASPARTGLTEYNGGPEDDFSFERAVKLYEKGE